MSFSVDFPVKDLPVSAEESNWFAAHNPIVVNMQRRDYLVTDTTNSAGKVKITTTTAITEALTANGEVYINSGAVEGVYKINHSPSSTEIVIDLAYSADTSGGFVNLNTNRPYYRIRVFMSKFDPVLTVYETAEEGLFTPSSKGVVQADISEYVRKFVTAVDEYDHVAANERDLNLSCYVKTEYQEEWYINTPSIAETHYMHVVNAAVQSKKVNAGNLAEFVIEPSGQDLAKWLTNFSRPTYWVGLPFDLSFIWSVLMGAATVKVLEVVTNENGSTTTPQHTLNVAGIGYVNRMKIPSTYSPQAKTTEIKLSDGSGTDYTTSILVDIIQCLPANPVFLKWLNLKGAWDYWCFSVRQTEGIEVKQGGTFETLTEVARLISKRSNSTLEMGAQGLTTEKKDGLKILLQSVQVEMYTGLDEDDAPIFKTVIISRHKFSPNTKSNRHSIELTIDLPDSIIQTQ